MAVKSSEGDTFHAFPKLPPEIRMHIWAFAHRKTSLIHQLFVDPRYETRLQKRRLDIELACKESRKAGLRTREIGPHMNLDIDFLYVRTGVRSQNSPETVASFLDTLKQDPIHSLVIKEEIWLDWKKGSTFLNAFPSLVKLLVVVEDTCLGAVDYIKESAFYDKGELWSGRVE